VWEILGKVFMALEERNNKGWLRQESGGPCENLPYLPLLECRVWVSSGHGFAFRICAGETELLKGISSPSKDGTKVVFQMVPQLYAEITLLFSRQGYDFSLEADTSN
jgi:hypothetical protein